LEAEKEALVQARQRINHHLESLLVAELNERVLEYDRPVYEAALRVVRGGVPFGGSRRKP
jgi:hypothetical protein